MSNLVVVREREPQGDSGFQGSASGSSAPDEEAVLEVARRHPVRAIVLDYTPGVERACAPETARVGVAIFGAPLRYGVELIAIRAACAEASTPSIVRRLVHGDVPTSIWWPGDLSLTPVPQRMTMIGRQFLFDSMSWRDARRGIQAVAGLLGQPHPPDIADLNWRRVAPLRRAIIHGVACEPAADQTPVTGVQIQYGPAHTAAACLVAGWLRSRLPSPEIDLKILDDDRRPDVELAVALHGVNWYVRAAMRRECVKVDGATERPFEIVRPPQASAESLASEMRNLGPDTALQDAVRAAG